MSPSGFFFLLISAMSCCAAPQYGSSAPCGPPPNVPYGEISGFSKHVYRSGEHVEYKCSESYTLKGNRVVRCMNGIWDEAPECLGSAPCGPPPDIRYGDIPSISKSVYRSGESVEYICLQYYTLNGNSVARCINGVWTNAPECLEPCSVREKDMKENNLRVKWSPDSKLYLPHGDFLEFGCQSGYEAPFGTEMRSYCLHRKLNYPKCFKRGFCELDQSAMFANNIHYSASSIVDYGETIIFQCYEGTMPENNLEAKCELGKLTYPKCVPGKKCDIPTIKHGQMDHPYPYYYQIDPGRSLDYRCDKNYLSHQREYWGKIWCTDNGWNPEPKCSRQCLSIKAAFENADLLNAHREYLEGETVIFRCRYDYLTPNGRNNGERTCLPNGEFTPAKCSKMCRAPELPNGKFIPKKDHFEFGEYLQYECNNGYMTKNRKLHSTAQCLSGGWSEMPSCIPITCTYKRVSYKDGHVIKYTCPKGQTPESEFGQCFYYGWGPPPDCQGEKIDQSEATDPPQGVYEYEEIECTISDETNVLRSPVKQAYRGQDQVSLSCEQGSIIKGSNIATCTPNGWNPPLPVCVEIECTISENFIWSPVKQIYREKDEVSLSCEQGFKIKGPSKTTCTANGWNPPLLLCVEIECTISDNFIRSPVKQIYREKDQVSLACKQGSKIEGSSTTTCNANGWNPPLPICIEIECTISDKTNLVRSPLKQVYRGQEQVSLSCEQGSIIKGSNIATCTPNGWNPPLPVCVEIKCTISENFIRTPVRQIYREKDQVSLSCEQGFKIKGSSKTTCTANGWNPPLPMCEEPCKAPELPNGKMYPNKDQFGSEEYLQYECNKGFMTKSRNVIRIAQCLNGRWSEEPSCIPITCTYKRVSYKDGHVIKYTCPKGQTPESEFGQCFYYGWGPPPDCQGEKIDQSGATDPPQGVYEYEEYADQSVATDPPPGVTENEEKRRKCPLAYHPINAKIKDPKEAYYSNDNVTMTCIGGYRIHGSPVVRCIEGKWEQPPECIQNPCAEPPDVMHVTVVEKKKTFYQGEKFKYECKKGFRLSGEDSASCVKGEWMNIPSCVATSCTSPPTVPNSKINGSIKASYESGETCTYECNADYSMGRSSTGAAMCENAQWIKVPVCKKIGAQCGPPPVVQYGDTISLINPSYNSSDSVEYKCSEYYSLTGNKNVTCLNGFWDEAPVCLEPCIVREEDMEDNNIQLKSGNKKTFVVHGESLEFDCKSGHEAPPGIQMRIVCEGQKLLEYPRCFKEGFCVLNQSAMITNNIYHNENAVLENGERFRFQCNKGTIPENNLEAKCEWKKMNYPKCVTAA